MSGTTIDTIYGQMIECNCGKTHHIDPQRVIYEDGALTRLPEVLSGCTTGRKAVLLMDSRTCEVAGKAAAGLLRDAGWQVSEIIMPDPAEGASPVCDDHTHDWLLRQIEAADVILPIATINGAKTLQRARPPHAILSDPAILRDAPYELTTAGLGDILAKSVSSADWRMNHFLFGDYFCERSVSLIAGIEPLYMNHPEDLRERKPEAMAALFHGLLLTGVAMTMAETSAAASGGEHLVSHTLDMMSSLDGVPHDLHGRQVGIGTVLASEVYRRIISLESPDFSRASMDFDKEFWGVLGDGLETHYGPKTERLQKAVEILSQGDSWDRLREEVKPFLRSPDQIRNCLKRAGAAFRAEDIECSRERLLCIVLHAHEIRSRFTVIDLARLVGVLPQAAGEIVEEWSWLIRVNPWLCRGFTRINCLNCPGTLPTILKGAKTRLSKSQGVELG
jgi:glycerol-1-phosphate dehydrogenase [NAD(P)+]